MGQNHILPRRHKGTKWIWLFFVSLCLGGQKSLLFAKIVNYVTLGSAIFLFACEAKPPAHVTDPGHLTYLGFTNRDAQCSRCHGDEGQGGMFGPKLRGIVQRKGADYVRKTILHGKGEGDDAMPPLSDKLTSEQIDQVIAFLATWKDSTAQSNHRKSNQPAE